MAGSKARGGGRHAIPRRDRYADGRSGADEVPAVSRVTFVQDESLGSIRKPSTRLRTGIPVRGFQTDGAKCVSES